MEARGLLQHIQRILCPEGKLLRIEDQAVCSTADDGALGRDLYSLELLSILTKEEPPKVKRPLP